MNYLTSQVDEFDKLRILPAFPDQNYTAKYLYFDFKDFIAYHNDELATIISPKGKTVSVPKYKVAMSDNYYEKNFAGYGKGLIDIFGYSRVVMENEYYKNNGENMVEVAELMLMTYPFLVGNSSLGNSDLDSYSLNRYLSYLGSLVTYETPKASSLMKSLISFTYGGHLYLSNVTFIENFLFEPSFSLKERSLLIFISQFKG
jgi:hypothetical protein